MCGRRQTSVTEQTVHRKFWFLSYWLSASVFIKFFRSDGSRLRNIFCIHSSFLALLPALLALLIAIGFHYWWGTSSYGHKLSHTGAAAHRFRCALLLEQMFLSQVNTPPGGSTQKTATSHWADQRGSNSPQCTQSHSLYTGHFISHHIFQRQNPPGFDLHT